MLFVVLQFLLCILCFTVLGLICKSGILKLLISLLAGIIVTTQLSSVIIGGAFIDFKYYAHFKTDVALSVGGFFKKESIILFLFFSLFTPLFYKLISSNNFFTGNKKNSSFDIPLFVYCRYDCQRWDH